jgi:uncharacterized membrane protein
MWAMQSVRERYRQLVTRGGDSDRMVYFSDAIFAIAITLLVIDLPRPSEGDGSAWDLIIEAVPDFFAYALSFVIIALNWAGHHRKFRVIKGHDGPLLKINLLLLFIVAFVPFPTSVLAEYGAQVAAVVLYAFVVGALSMVQLAIWAYARRTGLLDPRVDDAMYWYVVRGLLTTPTVFWLSIPVALLVSGDAALYCWFALIPLNVLVGLTGRRG